MKANIPIRTISGAVAIAISLLAVARWWRYINTCSVNILFWDQWDLYDGLFDNKSLWELFRWQHGPHRQGIGFIVTKVVAGLSGWNTRTESFVIGGVICLALIAALALRSRLGPRLGWTDAAIALIFLTPIQYELFAGTPNLSHGAAPLFLLMLYVLVWAGWRGLPRYAGILILNFLLVYTGFGVFVGMITPCLFAAEALNAYRARNQKGIWAALSGAGISLLTAGSFFIGYHFSPAVDGFKFPIREVWLYPQYMALMLANFCGVKGVVLHTYLCGFAILLLMGTLAAVHTVRVLRPKAANGQPPADAVIAVLLGFTLLFCANTAIGRICVGMPTAQSSRYATHLIPGFFGIYLAFVALPAGLARRFLTAMFVAGLIVASFPLRHTDAAILDWCVQGKTRWKAVYLRTGDIVEATRAAHFPIYPDPQRTHLKRKLELLKKEGLNLYLDAPKTGLVWRAKV